MAETNTGSRLDYLSAESILRSTPSTRAAEPQVGRGDCSATYCQRAPEADGLCERHLRDVTLLDVRWLSKDQAIVTWAWEHSSRTGADGHEGFTSVSVVWVDRCPADRSVGIDSAYYEVNSDAPVEVDELVAEAAAERDDGRGRDEREYEPRERIVESRMEAL